MMPAKIGQQSGLDINNAMAQAVRHYQAGQLAQAAALARQIAAAQPGHADAFNLLGVCELQQGRAKAAAAAFAKAVKARPRFAEAHYHLGIALREADRPDEAANSLRTALGHEPGHLNALVALAMLLAAPGSPDGKIDEGIALLRRAVALAPDNAALLFTAGNILRECGRFGEAEPLYRAALARAPNDVPSLNNLGLTLTALGRAGEALELYGKAVRLQPRDPKPHNNAGQALMALGRIEEAAGAFQQAVRLAPDFAEAHGNLGRACLKLGHREAAAAAFQRQTELRPRDAAAQEWLGLSLMPLGLLQDAAAAFERAMMLEPRQAAYSFRLGLARHRQDRWAEAIPLFRKATELDPSHGEARAMLIHAKQHLCDWDGLDGLTAQLREDVALGRGLVPPFVFLGLPTLPAEQLACARRWSKANIQAPALLAASPARAPGERLRIGYLSNDFHKHATAWLIAELFERHDRDRFEIFGYGYDADDGSDIRRRLIAGFDHFADLRPLSDLEAARRIQADGIHILVDLKGHTGGTRSAIAACRPAPVQAQYLGYPGTMGADFIDYVIADADVIPPGEEACYSEAVVRLPGSYQVNDGRRAIAADIPSRADCGLPEQGFVFCCFNNAFKIAPRIFDIWMRLLQAVPGSVLWLLQGDGRGIDNLRREAARRGVDPARLVFAGFAPLDIHLARHRLADLFLDTLPYNAHTTTSDALWAGLPVLTCRGDSFAGRVAASLLRAAGLPEMITASLEEYEAAALRLARAPDELQALKNRLATAAAAAPLFDCARFARGLEQAYEEMWAIHAAGEAPRAITIAAE